MTGSIYDTDFERNAANHVALSPLSFLRRAAAVFPERTAYIHGALRRSWADYHARCRRLSSALRARGIGGDDTVAILAANIPAFLEAHFGVPAAGAVLNAINIRLDAETVAYILDHSETKLLLADTAFSAVVKDALDRCTRKPLVIDIEDPENGAGGERLGGLDYEALLEQGDPEGPWRLPEDEWKAISLNYTSGTTGRPKGVVYHHRGAALTALGNVLAWSLPKHPVYLWTLPMFHCNGWCFPWTLPLVAGTHVCLRRVAAAPVFRAIAEHGVTHLCGAPVVMNLLINARPEEVTDFAKPVHMMTAASAPPPAVLSRIEAMGFRITHVYGLTETYGPAVVCDWHREWDRLDADRRAALKARQGVPYHLLDRLALAAGADGEAVPRDGATTGEVLFRGNPVMKGYLKEPEATREAFAGGWFHSGDLAVMHADGYIELKDRAKDIIVSGGENISTLEVEAALYRHPKVLEAAVVGRPDEHWGETPCAFVTLKPGERAAPEEIVAFCRDRLAGFKVPRTVVFAELPKTGTGKVRKHLLRAWARGERQI